MISEKEELFTSFWDLMDFSAGFSLILNSDFTIKLINKSLAEQIFDGERSLLIGKNWLDFVVEDDKELVKYSKGKLFGQKKLYYEIVYNIICKDNTTKQIKWIMSYINSDFNCIISTGVPANDITKSCVESTRTHYENLVLKDRILIEMNKDNIKEFNETIKERRLTLNNG